MTTDTDWVQVNMLTGEIKPLDEIEPKQRKTHRADVVFTAAVKLWGYEGQPLTKSLRGACNAACRDIKRYEKERDEAHTDEEIAEFIDAFGVWFKTYRRERFNEYCRRAPYPMETTKLWPEYRKPENSRSIASDWQRYIDARDASPNSIAYKKAHPELSDDDRAAAES